MKKLFFLLSLLVLAACTPNANTTVTDDQVKVDFYVMSQCPYGVQAEDGIIPALEKFGDAVDFNVEFIARETDAGFQSLHGEKEVTGDKIQLCVQKNYPDKFVQFLKCQNKDTSDLTVNLESCAKESGIDASKIETCYKGEEGSTLLRNSIAASDAVKAQGSPTIFVNNKSYKSARDTLSFMRAICNDLDNNPTCTMIPECATDSDCQKDGYIGSCSNPNTKDAKCDYTLPIGFDVKVLTSKNCTECNPSRINDVTKQLFPGAKFTTVDVADNDAKELIKKYSLKYMPAFIFDSDVEGTNTWKTNPNIKGAFTKLEDGNYRLKDEATGASTFISSEDKKKFLESLGIVTGDNKPQIDFYVMAFCPYGNQAEEAIEPAYQLLKDYADFNPHYVIYSNYQGGGSNYCVDDDSLLCSMHGIQEYNQDIRELCVKEKYGTDAWFKFALDINSKCSAQNADACYEGVAKDLGYDVDYIKSCYAENKETYGKQELKLNKQLAVSGSPTIFIDGIKYQGSRDSEGYKKALCAAFEDAPDACDETLQAASTTTAPSTGQC